MTDHATSIKPLTPPHEALAALLTELAPTESEHVPLADATGRVLAEPVLADRPSPACDVSAMDGYALRLADAKPGSLPVAGEVMTGQAPPALPEGAAMRIFTGGAVPDEADLVVKREDVIESPDTIELGALDIKSGVNIRRQGENITADECVLEPGRPITPAVAAALANFGITEPHVHCRVRVCVIVTGDELLEPEAAPEPWQLRDSNAETLRALLGPLPWVALEQIERVVDEPARLRDAIADAAERADMVLLTGGVSMGDHDHVPEAVEAIGGRMIFHKLALRPGKPMLGAVGPRGQAIIGLPGNPVSVMVTARRFALSALRKLTGFAEPDPPDPTVQLDNPGEKRLGLWWYRPVQLTGTGTAALVSTRGSGDLVSAARSDGFIELPPDEAGPGPWPFYAWSL